MLKSKKTVLVGLLTAVIIISGFIKIPMYPVPISAVFLTVNFIALSFDRKISLLSLSVYIGIGIAGLPVFAGGGGIGYVFSPSFGYLIGFVAICIYSNVLKKTAVLKKYPFTKNILISLVNMFAVYLIGALYGYLILKFYLKEAIDFYFILIYYVVIFIPGDLFASALSSYFSKRFNSIGNDDGLIT